jgi:hypothetical protein
MCHWCAHGWIRLDFGTRRELCSLFVLRLRVVVGEVAALISLVLFLATVAVWAQVLGAL